MVHDGAPTDSTAGDYYVRYRDYIKNVASSEIYATWPSGRIRADVLAIMSFTLNRVYTEWYRNRGFDFTITSPQHLITSGSTAAILDDSISHVVDELFADYLSAPTSASPSSLSTVTGSASAVRTGCDSGVQRLWLIRDTQPSKSFVIIMVTTCTSIQRRRFPVFLLPGYDLDIGATGPKVEQMQEQLNAISKESSLIADCRRWYLR